MLTDDSQSLQKGDALLLYTDGITESYKTEVGPEDRGISKRLFGDEKLWQVFEQHGHRKAGEIKDKLLEEIKDDECTDDITVLVIKRC